MIFNARKRIALLIAICVTLHVTNAIAQTSYDTKISELSKQYSAASLSLTRFTDLLIAESSKAEPPAEALTKDLLAPDLSEEIGHELLKRAQKELLENSRESILPFLKTARRIFPSKNTILIQLERLSAFAERFEHFSQVKNTAELENMLPQARTEFERELLKVLFARYYLQAARERLNGGFAEEALGILAKIDLSLDNDAARQLTADAVVKLVRESSAQGNESKAIRVLDNPEVRILVSRAEQNDPGLKEQLVTLFQRRLIAAVADDDPEQAVSLLADILKRRPDPSIANDEMRFQIATTAEGERIHSFVEGRLRELKASKNFTFSQRLTLLVRGYFGKIILRIAVIALAILLVLAAIAFLPIERMGELPRNLKGMLRGRAKVKLGFQQTEMMDDEYGKLLKRLRLPDTAKENDIKQAYRRLMKELHPDHRNDHSPEAEEEFRKIQEAYDRLLEIRKAWFGR